MEPTPIASLLGGCLVGLAAALLLLGHGRVAGISGIVGGLLESGPRRWQAMFVAGLVAGGVLVGLVAPLAFGRPLTIPLWLVALGGVLVGIGTRLGGGCTSGHGVCGISRGSTRSVVATGVFMLVAMLVVLVTRHGGAS